jgi:hypothetical protein
MTWEELLGTTTAVAEPAAPQQISAVGAGAGNVTRIGGVPVSNVAIGIIVLFLAMRVLAHHGANVTGAD